MSWDPVVAAVKCSYEILHAVWSPCSRFIAIDCSTEIQILDGVTLERVKSLALQRGHPQVLTFSADARLLTGLSGWSEESTSWDLQTGVPVSAISTEQEEGQWVYTEPASITYSECGTMFGVLFKRHDVTVIITYNVLSGRSVGYHQFERSVTGMIWTHGKCVRFAALEPGSITIWEVGFISEHPAAEVESLPTPGNFDLTREFLFLPTLSRLAFVLKNRIFVWDIQHSKLLLSCVDIEEPTKMTFSSDGRFFACATNGPEIYLWKDSPTGYTLHRKLMSSASKYFDPWKPLLSPDGRSILAFKDSTLQLWHTTDTSTSLSSVPTQTFQSANHFVLGFSPGEPLAAAARLGDNTATVLDLRSGVPRLKIDAGMEIYGLGVAGSTVIVVGDGRIVTWNLPQSDRVLNATTNIDDSTRTTTFDPPVAWMWLPPSASISPDFNHIAIVRVDVAQSQGLNIYDMTTGKHLAGIKSDAYATWFTPNGHELWCCCPPDKVQGWAIVKDSESDPLKMECLEPTQRPPEGCPWIHPRGYRVTDDGWIHNSNGKRLLWLPPHWRPHEMDKMWSGCFLAFLHYQLPEVVILEVLEE